jgi:fumarate reductase flavoprotein subunit
VANSTVFGAIAGDTMADWTLAAGAWREPAPGALEDAEARARHPLGRKSEPLEAIREALHTVMWEDAGILRDAQGLQRADQALDALHARLMAAGVPAGNLRYNLTWHDWLNLESLITVSRAICAAALAREDSRGAHFREDHPETGALTGSAFTRVTMAQGRFAVGWKPVHFTRVSPGQTLITA